MKNYVERREELEKIKHTVKCGGGLKDIADNEIKKALECCVRFKQICPETCPMVNVRQCKVDLRKNTLALINRQKAEIERLTASKSTLLKEFAERLKSEYADFDKKYEVILPENLNKAIDDLLKELVGGDIG